MEPEIEHDYIQLSIEVTHASSFACDVPDS